MAKKRKTRRAPARKMKKTAAKKPMAKRKAAKAKTPWEAFLDFFSGKGT